MVRCSVFEIQPAKVGTFVGEWPKIAIFPHISGRSSKFWGNSHPEFLICCSPWSAASFKSDIMEIEGETRDHLTLGRQATLCMYGCMYEDAGVQGATRNAHRATEIAENLHTH